MLSFLRRVRVVRAGARVVRPHSDFGAYRAKQSRAITPTVIALGVIPIVTFALGTWQVKRLGWKVALIEELEEKLRWPPLPLPEEVKYARLFTLSPRRLALTSI